MMSTDQSVGIPEFIFCDVCLAPRDVYENVDGLWLVDDCDECGDPYYVYSIQDEAE